MLLIAVLLSALSGVPALSTRMPLFAGRRLACFFMLAATACALYAVSSILLFDQPPATLQLSWNTSLGPFSLRLDPLSAFFVIPVVLVGSAISVYGCGYCATSPRSRGEAFLTFFTGVCTASVLMLLLAFSVTALLTCWELMALSVFIVMSLEHDRPEVRNAGMQYLVASHLTIVAIIIVFALLAETGGPAFPATGSLDAGTPLAGAIFLIALLGFGLKAGLMPLHVWLPDAHANAPSNISAFMSGIILKMGIYGIVRLVSFYAAPPMWWGMLLLCLGVVSAVAGVLFAIGQHDIKRLLAYHSIENIGIIVMGLGLAIIGLADHNRTMFVLGMAGALLHVLNHALFKSLLFLGAGVVIHASGTRDIDRMGGLSRVLPVTSVAFLAGSAAICALPPLNGFVSELLIYLGFFSGFATAPGMVAAAIALAAVALALTGGLAVACFAKVYGTTFLGVPRQGLPEGHEHPAMNAAFGLLAGLCVLIGMLPFAVAHLLEPVIVDLYPDRGELLPSIQAIAHLYGVSAVAVALLLVIVLLLVYYLNRLKQTPVSASVTWDCGYVAPSPRMQYTSSSFADMLVGIFGGILRPERHEPKLHGLFPPDSDFHSHVPEVTLEKGVLPLLFAADRRISAIRRLQSGQLNRYLMYIFVALIILAAISGLF